MGLFGRRKHEEPSLRPGEWWQYTYEVNLAGGHIGGPKGERQRAIAMLAPGQKLQLVRERDNPHDPNAVAVHAGGVQPDTEKVRTKVADAGRGVLGTRTLPQGLRHP